MTIPIKFLTTLIKKSAVTRRYKGGIDAFRVDYPEALEDGYMFGVVRMSGSACKALAENLCENGLVAEGCYAVADMMLGPMKEYSHFIFRNLSNDFPPFWVGVLISDDPEVLAEEGAALLSWLMANEMKFDAPSIVAHDL